MLNTGEAILDAQALIVLVIKVWDVILFAVFFDNQQAQK
jgi:hypothetical protein